LIPIDGTKVVETRTFATALYRHKTQHIPKSLALEKGTIEEAQTETLFDTQCGSLAVRLIHDGKIVGRKIPDQITLISC
jgi:hypothetical protein